MTSIQVIADNIYNNVKPKSPREFVFNFEKYGDVVNSFDSEMPTIDYEAYSRLIADYGIALADTQAYKKAIPVIEKSLLFLKNNPSFSSESLPGLPFYETLLFKFGVSLYYLKNYQLAKEKFELLKNLYPDNIFYPNWLLAIRDKKLSNIKNGLWFCTLCLTVLEPFFKKPVKNIFLGFTTITLIAAIVFEILLHIRRKKYGA
jgi:tetratricopeptide (TPR) repeat protein